MRRPVDLEAAAPVDLDALERLLDPATTGSMLPADAYLEPTVLDWERSHLFDHGWVCAGRTTDLAHPGARRAVAVGDDSVLLVRGDDAVLRGFFNVCQHRAHELSPCDVLTEHRSVHCPYHGWRYGLDGTLLSTPRFEAPVGFDRAEHGLRPVAVADWHGWAMVNLSGTAASVSEHFAGVEDRLAPYEPERLTVGASHTYEIAANWKLVVENYHECFHCPNIHPELCRVSPPTSGQNHAGHHGLWVGGWQELMPHAATMSLDGTSKARPLRGLDEAAIRRIDYIGLFPNLLVSLHPDYVMTHRMVPRAPGRTWIECQWLFDPESMFQPEFDPSFAVEFWDLTNRQDWSACEGVQRGLASRGYHAGPFGEDEDAVASFVRMVARAYLSGRALPVPA